MATQIPSGMLCTAIATASATPSLASARAATKVARPSGKLWSAMAHAVRKPIRLRCFFDGVSIESITALDSMFSESLSLSLSLECPFMPSGIGTSDALPNGWLAPEPPFGVVTLTPSASRTTSCVAAAASDHIARSPENMSMTSFGSEWHTHTLSASSSPVHCCCVLPI